MKIVKINSENGLLSAGDLPGMTVVFLCAFFVITFFYERKQNGKNQTQSIFQSPRPAHGSDDGADHDAEWHGGGVPH